MCLRCMRDPPSAWHRASYSEEYFGTQGNPLVRGTYKAVGHLQGFLVVPPRGDCAALSAECT